MFSGIKTHSSTIRRANSRCSGAALSEFAIVLPLLVIFLTGLLELGRTINQMAWLSQTSYEAARAAGNTAGPQGQVAVQNVGNLYYSLFAKDLEGDPTNLQGEYLPAKRMVRVTLEDRVRVLLGAVNFDVRFDLTGPHLASPAPSLSTEYSNGATLYNCNGVAGGSDTDSFCCHGSHCSGSGAPPVNPECKYFAGLAGNCAGDDGLGGGPPGWIDELLSGGR